MQKVYTVADLCKALDLSHTTVRKLIKEGKLKKLQGVGAIRVPSWSLEQFLKADKNEH